ncbi:MAG: nucleoid-associated protein [Bacteroidia bacterium]|nr:nucleoid-associated protein [Bacteroidia bacterium]
MLNYGNSNILEASLHFCGNKNNGEDVALANHPLELSEQLSFSLADFILHPFSKLFEEYQFMPESLAKPLVAQVFSGEKSLHEASKELTEHLYEVSEHPKIGSGDVLVCYVKGLAFSNVFSDGMVILKFENTENFLLTDMDSDGGNVTLKPGIRNSRFDKGCLILNLEEENGFRCFVIDNASRGDEAYFWKERFLGLAPKQDKHFQTKQLMNVYKDFVVEELPQKFEVSKAEQSDLLARSVNYMKENDRFRMQEFEQQVMSQPEVINAFKGYVEEQTSNQEYTLPEEFEISAPAVKKQGKFVRSVIKLDKNFHLYVHGNREYIQRGFDEQTGMHFYKLYFKEEA